MKSILAPFVVVHVHDTSCEIESLANRKRKVVHENNLKRFTIEYNVDKVPEGSDDIESSESEFDDETV